MHNNQPTDKGLRPISWRSIKNAIARRRLNLLHDKIMDIRRLAVEMEGLTRDPMDRTRYVLAVTAYQGEGATFTPVQLQKLFFLLDREIPSPTNGPWFAFQPYDYGPFDKGVYHEFERLKEEGLAIVSMQSNIRTYQLTEKGLDKGIELASQLPEEAKSYIKRAGDFVRRLSFGELVSSIYKAYPEMKSKSIFRQ
jgi:uncharacterized protein